VPNAAGRYGDLQVYYPPTTLVSDHPFCVLRADWVSAEKSRAATQFLDYLLSKPAQELALTKYGYRPVDTTISLDGPSSPFTRLAANGIRIDLPIAVEIPSGDVLAALLNYWDYSVNKAQ
jgi:ABC-type sulfate transport system substrate-binding protein